MPKNQFSSGHQPGTKRGKDKRKMMLDAIKKVTGFDEEEFFAELVALGWNGKHDAVLNEVIKRVYPVHKPTMPAIENFSFPENATEFEKCLLIQENVANGTISPDTGELMIRMINHSIEIKEKTEMHARIEALEKLMAETNETNQDQD